MAFSRTGPPSSPSWRSRGRGRRTPSHSGYSICAPGPAGKDVASYAAGEPKFGASIRSSSGWASQRVRRRASAAFEGFGTGGHGSSLLHCQQGGADWERSVLCRGPQRDAGCSKAGSCRREVGAEDLEGCNTLGQPPTQRRRQRQEGRWKERETKGWQAEGRRKRRSKGGGEGLLEERRSPEGGSTEVPCEEVRPTEMTEELRGQRNAGLLMGGSAGGAVDPQVQLEPLRDGFLKEASQQEVSQVNEEAAMTPLVSPVCRTLREFGGSLMSHVHLLKHCKSWSMVTDAFDRNLFSVDSTGTHVGQLTLPPPEWVALTDLALQDLADEPEGENSERLVNLVKSQLERFGIWDEVVTPISFAEFFTSKKVDYQGEEIRVAQYVVWEAVSNSFPMEVGKLDLLDFCSLGTHYYVSHFEEFLVDPSAQRQVKPPKVMVDDSQWAEVCRGLIDRGVCEVWPVDELHHIGGAPLLNGLFAVGKGEFVGSLETQRLIMNLIPTNSIALSIQGDLPTLPMVSGLGGILLEEGKP